MAERSSNSPFDIVASGLGQTARAFVVLSMCFHWFDAVNAYQIAASKGITLDNHPGSMLTTFSLNPWSTALLCLEVLAFVAWVASTYQASCLAAGRPVVHSSWAIVRGFFGGRSTRPFQVIREIRRYALGDSEAKASEWAFAIWWAGVVLWGVATATFTGMRLSHLTLNLGLYLTLIISVGVGLGLLEAVTAAVITNMTKQVSERRDANKGKFGSPQRPPTTPAILRRPTSTRVLPAPAPLDLAAIPEFACACCGLETVELRCLQCGAALRCGGFRVVRQLGRSSHARTYLATAEDGKLFALKELSFALAPDAQAIDAFEREGQMLGQLRHPQIPRFVKAFSAGEGAALRFYLAQEYIEGQSLSDLLKDGAFPAAEVADLVGLLLNVLHHLHTQVPRIIHRDVKPSNVIRRPNGEIALIDFGAARELGQTMMDATLVGTFGYMPPQQLAGQIDETSDLYAVGASALHLLTGRPPWELLSEEMRLELPKQVQVSPDFANFLLRLASPQRRVRFQSAAEALLALDALSVEGAAVA